MIHSRTRGSLQTMLSTQVMQSEKKSVLPASAKFVCSSPSPSSCSSNASSNTVCPEKSSSIRNNELMENIHESANDGDDNITHMAKDESVFEEDDTSVYEEESVITGKKTPRPDTFKSSKRKRGNDIEAMLVQSSVAF